MFWNTRSSLAWCVLQPPASSAWASCSCCCPRSGTQSRCASSLTSQTRSLKSTARSSPSPVLTPEAAVGQTAPSPSRWRDVAELSSRPFSSSIHCPPGTSDRMLSPDGLVIRMTASIVLNFEQELHLHLHWSNRRRGNCEHLLILQISKSVNSFVCHAQPCSSHAPAPRAVCPPLTCSVDCILWI